jgi:hypothetical protein
MKGGLFEHLAACLCNIPLTLLGNGSVNTPAAISTHATTEEQLDVVFYAARFVSSSLHVVEGK